MPPDDLSFTAPTDVVSATPADTAGEIKPLTSPPLTPELGGTPVEAAYAPAGPATEWGVNTLFTLLLTLEMYSPFVNTTCLYSVRPKTWSLF
jgi:hypothetical protein